MFKWSASFLVREPPELGLMWYNSGDYGSGSYTLPNFYGRFLPLRRSTDRRNPATNQRQWGDSHSLAGVLGRCGVQRSQDDQHRDESRFSTSEL